MATVFESVRSQRSASLWTYSWRFVLHPRRTWKQLLAEPARLRCGSLAVLFVGIGYALTVCGIAASNGMPSAPWIAIPAADYFKWEAMFIAPVTLLCWVLAAGVMHLLSKAFHGRGTFDDTLALLGFAVALPTLISLIPDAARSALTSVGVLKRAMWEEAVSQVGTGDWLFLWSYMLAYLVGLLVLFPLSVAAAQQLRRWPAVIVGVTGAVVYQGVYLIFVR
jgi:hypothetical protein